jgi:hypothetical protein
LLQNLTGRLKERKANRGVVISLKKWGSMRTKKEHKSHSNHILRKLMRLFTRHIELRIFSYPCPTAQVSTGQYFKVFHSKSAAKIHKLLGAAVVREQFELGKSDAELVWHISSSRQKKNLGML